MQSHKRKCRHFEKVFINRDFIDAFEDDYFYDCVEVTPELLKQLPIEDDAVVNNSFLVHGYYNFKHILFGKVCENDNNTRYFYRSSGNVLQPGAVYGIDVWLLQLQKEPQKRLFQSIFRILVSGNIDKAQMVFPFCRADIHRSKQCLPE